MYEQRDTSVPRKKHADYRDKKATRVQLKPETYIEWTIALIIGTSLWFYTVYMYMHVPRRLWRQYTSAQYWANVSDVVPALSQRLRWSVIRASMCEVSGLISIHICREADTSRSPNVGLMLAQRLRRWANINPTLGQRLVFSGEWWMDRCPWTSTTLLTGILSALVRSTCHPQSPQPKGSNCLLLTVTAFCLCTAHCVHV